LDDVSSKLHIFGQICHGHLKEQIDMLSIRHLQRTLFLLFAIGLMQHGLLFIGYYYQEHQKESSSLPLYDRLVEWRVGPSLPTTSSGSSSHYHQLDTSLDRLNRTVSSDTLDGICSIFPGHGIEEGGLYGYQVLVRLRHLLPIQQQQQQQVENTVLCVWLVLTDGDQHHQRHGVYRTARKLYGHDCHGILQVYVTADDSAGHEDQPLESSASNFHSLRIPFLSTESLQQVFLYIASLSDNYRWFHWTDPWRFFLVTRHLLWRLQEIAHGNNNRTDELIVLQPWIITDINSNTEYHQLYGKNPPESCGSPQTANQPVARRLALCQVAVPNDLVLNGTGVKEDQQNSWQVLQDWMESCLARGADQTKTCHRPNPGRDRHTKWMYLRRYAEIELNGHHERSAANVSRSLIRLNAILRGQCDHIWDKPMGALDANGRPGYIHDPTFLRNNPPPFTFHVPGDENGVCEIPFGEGDEGKYGLQGLRKIEVASSFQTNTRVLCMVYTQSTGHFRVRSIAETWGPRCDGFLAASNMSDPSIGAVHLLHEGPESYDNMWLKVRAMFQYVHDHYLDDFDFVHIGGDDMYVIPENLRYTVSTGSWRGPWNGSEPLFLGGSLAKSKKIRYCQGGSGYTLNRAALQLLVSKFPSPHCKPHWQDSKEDQAMSSCFRSVGILCTDTNDEQNETRYHTWNAEQHAAWTIDKPGQDWTTLRDNHGIAWLEGLGQISRSSVRYVIVWMCFVSV
jgi:glycoprotein-N-acetylgalactosamine 3-beta-galactosyltransferase